MKKILPIFLVLWLSACSFSLAADVTPPPGYQPASLGAAPAPATSGPLYPMVPPSPEQGAAIYAEKCAPCHGTTGLGDGPSAAQLPNPVTALGSVEVARAATPAQWFTVVSRGNLERFMPAFQSLSDRQRWDVVAYALRLSLTSSSLEQGAALYAENCAICHGEGGKGDGPRSAGLALDFTNQELMAKKSLADLYQGILQGHGENMPAFAQQFTEEEIWSLAGYLRTLTFAPQQASAAASSETATATPEPELSASPVSTETVQTASPATGVLREIKGSVTNLTGSEGTAGLEVMLHILDEQQQVMTATTTTDASGNFVFEGVEFVPGQSYLTTVKFQNVTYGSELLQAREEQSSLELPIEVYESTTDTSGLVVDRLHYFIEALTEDRLRVVELYIISNPSTKTVAAPALGQPVLTFSLPPGAENLQFQDGVLGGRYLPTADGFGDQMPVRPGQGEYQVLYSYELPYDGKLEITRKMGLNIGALVILIPEDGIKLRGETIQDAGVREVQGVSYHLYNGQAMTAGQELTLTISGRPGNSASLVGGSSNNLVIGLLVFGAVLIGAGVWLYRRNKPVEIETEELEAEPPVGESPETIMDAILALDDLYQEGQLAEDVYRQRRAELKEQLRQAMANRAAAE